MALADSRGGSYIAASLGDGLAAGAAGTQIPANPTENRKPKTSCFCNAADIVSALQSNRLGNENGEANGFLWWFFAV
jgi:hypothetical protein